jgi:polysaccharide biosynthesis protein PslH
MNVLMLCKKVPYPPTDGESIVIMKDLEALKALGVSVSMACLNTEKHFVNTEKFSEKKMYWDAFFDKKIDSSLRFSHFFSYFIHKKPLHLVRFWDKSFLNSLKSIIQSQKIDCVLCQGLPMIWYAKELQREFGVNVIYRAHNIEYKIWNQLSYSSSNLIKNWGYKSIAKSLEAYEKKVLGFCDSILTLNSIEQDFFHAFYPQIKCREIAISLGNTNATKNHFPKDKIKLLITGSMDWKPNLEGVDWFLAYVWPQLSKDNFELTIAGKGIENGLNSTYDIPEVTLIGKYESVQKLFQSHDLLLIPLFTGAGIRIKVIEAMQFGIPFIGTEVALEGIPDMESSIVEDSHNQWIEKINSFFNHSTELEIIAEKNKITYNQYFTNDIIKQKWQSIFY